MRVLMIRIGRRPGTRTVKDLHLVRIEPGAFQTKSIMPSATVIPRPPGGLMFTAWPN